MYKKIKKEGKSPRYLEIGNLRKIGKGKMIRSLIRLRCGNMEEDNKYWLGEELRGCVFYKEGMDNLYILLQRVR